MKSSDAVKERVTTSFGLKLPRQSRLVLCCVQVQVSLKKIDAQAGVIASPSRSGPVAVSGDVFDRHDWEERRPGVPFEATRWAGHPPTTKSHLVHSVSSDEAGNLGLEGGHGRTLVGT